MRRMKTSVMEQLRWVERPGEPLSSGHGRCGWVEFEVGVGVMDDM